MTTTPARPAAYIRVADTATTDDPRMHRQGDIVTAAARSLGWPQPAVYADAGAAAQPGSQLTALTTAITQGHHDAIIVTDPARISRSTAQLETFRAHCRTHHVPIYLTTGEQLTNAAVIALHAGIADR
jgi:DNA invertase Pin-like site-specific DNA recombinase